MNEDKEMVPVSQLREAEARAERAEAELSKEKESMVQKAMELLSSCSCDKHTAVSFSEFYDAEKAAGCAQCQKERAEKAEADAKRLAFELELEQNPGYTCEALRVHYALVAAHDAGKDGGE